MRRSIFLGFLCEAKRESFFRISLSLWYSHIFETRSLKFEKEFGLFCEEKRESITHLFVVLLYL